MTDFYMSRIDSYISKHPSIGKEEVTKMFGSALELYELRGLSKEEAVNLYYAMKKAVALHESPYDINKIAHAIQSSRSGIGGCAMTNFECAFCGKTEMWGSTAVPRICKSCATDMATDIVMNKMDLLKEEEK